jgi:D-alanine--poly(phosphoribitol) ligase subunit 1
MVDPVPVYINDPVYVMFTSGSTGKPKGVVVACRGLMNLMVWGEEHVAPMVRPDTKDSPIIWANINPLHFDNSVFDLFCGLLNGHTLVPIETGRLLNPAQWVKVINHHSVELIFCVPTLFQTLNQLRMLTPKRLPTVRLFSFGGEGYPIQELTAFYNAFKGHARLLNVYGPTETSCICSSIEIDDNSLSVENVTFPSIGRMHNGHIPLVLKADGTVADSDEVGELWIGGDGVALGYFNDSGKTGAAFLQNPMHDLYTDIWYRTGDLVSIDADGDMWFLGRTDNQVKIRGYRIELEEIDATIERFKGVSRANTVVISKGDADELVTVYIASLDVTDENILEYCTVYLPKYMVPRQVIKMDKLPQNSNGKVDRKSIKALVEQQL